MRVRYSVQALRDIASILDRLAAEGGPGLPNRFIESIDSASDFDIGFPGSGAHDEASRNPHADPRSVSVSHFLQALLCNGGPDSSRPTRAKEAAHVDMILCPAFEAEECADWVAVFLLEGRAAA